MTRNTVPAFAADYPEVAQTLGHTRLPFYCCNCQRKRETTYLTDNFGPFCDDCLKEVPQFTCSLCTIDDGLVREWVMKVRDVARSKGLL